MVFGAHKPKPYLYNVNQVNWAICYRCLNERFNFYKWLIDNPDNLLNDLELNRFLGAKESNC